MGKWDQYQESSTGDKWEQYAEIPTSNEGIITQSLTQSPLSYVKELVGNIPASLYQTTISPIIHPIETSKGILGLIWDVAKGVSPDEPRPYAEAFRQQIKERYSDPIKTLRDDPIGMLADLSALLSASGTSIRLVPRLASVGKTISKAGTITEPFNVAKQTAGLVTKVIPESLPRRMYESSLKMPPITSKYTQADRQAIATTGLKEAILPTEKGLEKLQFTIDSINNEITEKINAAAKQGVIVNADSVINSLDELKEYYKNAPDPSAYLDTIDNLRDNFLKYHGQKIPIDKAQKIKQTTYNILRKQYGEMKTVSIESQKAVARGIKEAIADLYPEINTLNARESSLLRLEEVIERAVKRVRNRDIIPLGTMVGGTRGSIVKWILDDAAVKARLAITLNRARRSVKLGKYTTPARQIATQVGRITEEQSQ